MQKIYFRSELCDGCQACELACKEKHSQSQSVFMAKIEKPEPRNRIRVDKIEEKHWAVLCQHCVEAKCVEACMAGAMQYSEEGEVIHSVDQCAGCFMCVMVCPFGAVLPLAEEKKAGKCNLCKDEKVLPCVRACTRKALIYCTPEEYEMKVAGDWDAVSNRWK